MTPTLPKVAKRIVDNSIFDLISDTDLHDLAYMCGLGNIANSIVAEYRIRAQHHSEAISNKKMDSHKGKVAMIEWKWYKSLKRDSSNPDYSVYSEPYYLGNLWLCWRTYSRRALLALASDKSMNGKSVVTYLNTNRDKVESIVDLGCGCGYTTAALLELFPHARVVGTNIPTSFQFPVARAIGKTRGFSIIADLPKKRDVIFASEYFEHWQKPVEHLRDVLDTVQPRAMLVANSFNGYGIGHFRTYLDRGKSFTGREIGRLFHDTLRQHGFEKIPTHIWNSRPTLWQRVYKRRSLWKD